jgi:phenylalanine-4-hydroxylase
MENCHQFTIFSEKIFFLVTNLNDNIMRHLSWKAVRVSGLVPKTYPFKLLSRV